MTSCENKSILVSIRPKYVTDILNRKKTIEIRKTKPNCDQPITVYIYCSKRPRIKDEFNNPKYNGTVVGKFELVNVEEIEYDTGDYFTETLPPSMVLEEGCLDYAKLDHYLKGKKGYAWHITNLEVFDEPKYISEFKVRHYPQFAGMVKNETHYELLPLARAPQSWCYVEVEE